MGIKDLPQLDVNPSITFILLLDVLKVVVECLGLTHFTRGGEFLGEGEEFVVVAAAGLGLACESRFGGWEEG